jgi:phage/plasmid-associated DNA primase
LLNGFRQHRKEDYVTQCDDYDYIPNSDKTEISNLLNTIFPDECVRDHFLTLLSSSLFGKMMPYFVILTGVGRNGKDSIMSRIVPSMLGCYHYQGNHLAVTEESKTDLNVTIASFHKKRLVFMNEPPEGKTIKNQYC